MSTFAGNTTQKQVYIWWSPDGLTMVPVSNANPLPVTGGGGGGGAVTIANGADVALGSTTDAKSTATDGTAVTAISILKEISFMEQNPVSRAVTNAGTFAVQAAQSGTWTVGLTPGQSLAANQSVNVSQVNGVTTQTGAGAVGTGSQRVSVGQDTTTIAGSAPGTAGTPSSNVLTVQGTTSMTKLLVTPDSVALPANQSVNVSQINAVTPLMGNGVTGTGSLRTTTPSDNSAVALWGHGATAATVPANGVLSGGRAATATPTAVTDGQMVAAMYDKIGRTTVAINSVRALAGDQTTSLSNTTAETTVVTAGGANVFLDLTEVICANTGASATEISFRDATAGSVRFTLYVPAGDTRGCIFPTPKKQTTSNNNWTAQCATATTAMKISIGYVGNL